MSGWVVGVDAGGTGTRALAAELEGDGWRSATGAAANWTVHGPATCRERIERVVSEAVPAGGRPAAVCIGLAGYYPPEHAEAVAAWVAEAWPDVRTQVAPDLVAAWAGALAGEPGVVVISGTGSACYGGGEARAGGWGPLFGDEGSGYDVGVRCLRGLAREVDAGAALSPLARRVLARWPELGADLRAWLRGVYRRGWGREEVAELAREVSAAAAEGDPAARGLLADAAASLASLARMVERALGEPGLPVAVQGGMASAPGLREAFAERLRGMGSSLVPALPRFTPVEGALLLAAEAARGGAGLMRVRERLEQRGAGRRPHPEDPRSATMA